MLAVIATLIILTLGGMLLIKAQLSVHQIARQRNEASAGVRELVALIQQMQSHRQLNAFVINGEEQKIHSLFAIHDAISETNKRISALAIINQHGRWQGYLDHWQRLRARCIMISRQSSFIQHSHLIDNLIALVEDTFKSSTPPSFSFVETEKFSHLPDYLMVLELLSRINVLRCHAYNSALEEEKLKMAVLSLQRRLKATAEAARDEKDSGGTLFYDSLYYHVKLAIQVTETELLGHREAREIRNEEHGFPETFALARYYQIIETRLHNHPEN